jgi:O-antigen ligase
VRPLSIIFAILLLFLLVISSVRQRRFLVWNNSLLPLLAFALVALLSSSVGSFLSSPDLYSYTYENRLIRAWITFGVGLIFLIVPMSMNRDEQDLKFTLKWLYIGLLGHVLWSAAQLYRFFGPKVYLDGQTLGKLVELIQNNFLMAGLSPNQRISGLALEPSWLAGQILTVYLPWAFASLMIGYHWGKRRWLAPVILVGCAGFLLFTYSRSGILTAAGAVLLTMLVLGGGWMRTAWELFMRPFYHRTSVLAKQIFDVSVRISLITLVIIGMGYGLNFISHNRYFTKIWQSEKRDLVSYFVDIYAGPRLAYAWAGWVIYEQHPWTGVGLGATGLYIYPALPDWSRFNITEISKLLSPTNQTYPNSKNLYIRLLAETGILGFWLFISFYLLNLGKVLSLLKSLRKELVFVGTASLLAWFGIVALGFTQDSFAMLNIWMPMGIMLGMAESRV